MTTFEDLKLNSELIEVLNEHNFINPMPVQEKTIPTILDKKDIFALAKTGSGKTGAFLIPLIHLLLEQKNSESSVKTNGPSYLIVTPTRELAIQIYDIAVSFGKKFNIKSLKVIGGESAETQKENAKAGFEIVIGTPGRILDLLTQKVFNFKNASGIVFDEVDRLFDMGFKKDIVRIISAFPKDRQLLMFSATTNMEVLNTAYKYHSVPVEIDLGIDTILVDKISQNLFHVGDREKMPLMAYLLKERPDSHTLIFCNTKVETTVISEWLCNQGMKADGIYGNLSQSKRNSLIDRFRNRDISVLVSTDVAARGLDIDDITLVINYDLPQDSSNYVHRIGRTGRAGKHGEAISFCSYEDCAFLDPIEDYIGEKIPTLKLDESMLQIDVGPRPRIKIKRDGTPLPSKNESYKNSKSAHAKSPQRTKREERPPIHKAQNKKVNTVMNNTTSAHVSGPKRPNPKFFNITTTKFNDAQSQALTFFPINKSEHLRHEITAQGRKAFFIFGARKTTYKFTVKPEYYYYTDVYLHEVLRMMDIDVDFDIEVKDQDIQVSFTGADLALLKENNGAILESLDHLLKKYLGRFIVLGRSFKIYMGREKRDFSNQNRSERPRKAVNEKKLIALADKMKEKFMTKKKPVIINPLSPAERRIIHQHLDGDADVKTSSLGNGRFKKIRIDAK